MHLCRSHVNRVPANSPFYTFSAQCCLLSRNEGCFTAIALAFAMLSNKTNKYIQFELVLVTEAIGSCLIKQKALCPHSALNIFWFHFSPCACPFSTCQFRNLSLSVCMLLLARAMSACCTGQNHTMTLYTIRCKFDLRSARLCKHL